MLAYAPQQQHQLQLHLQPCNDILCIVHMCCTHSTKLATYRSKHATTNIVLLSCVVLVLQPLYASYWKDVHQRTYVCMYMRMCCIAYCDFVHAKFLVSPRSCQQSMTVCRVCSRLRVTYFLKAFVAGPAVQLHRAPKRPLGLY